LQLGLRLLYQRLQLIHKELVLGDKLKVRDVGGEVVHGLVPDKVIDQLLQIHIWQQRVKSLAFDAFDIAIGGKERPFFVFALCQGYDIVVGLFVVVFVLAVFSDVLGDAKPAVADTNELVAGVVDIDEFLGVIHSKVLSKHIRLFRL
jgi:hypothetical protein